MDGLTRRERDVIAKVLAGSTNSTRLADTLGISERTARTHLSNIYAKWGIGSMGDMILMALNDPALLDDVGIEGVRIMRLLPGDVVCLMVPDSLSDAEMFGVQRKIQSVLPPWAKSLALRQIELSILRGGNGGEKAEANGAEGAAGQSGQARTKYK